MQSLPWSAHMAKTIRGLCVPALAYCIPAGVDTPKSLEDWMEVPLKDRLPGVFELAAQASVLAVAAQALQDPRVAQNVASIHTARLGALKEFLTQLPPSAYDLPISERIIQLRKQPPDFMSPVRQQELMDGTARLIATQLGPFRQPYPKPVPMVVEEEDLEVYTPPSPDDSESDRASSVESSLGLNPERVPERERKVPKRFEAGPHTGSKKRGKEKASVIVKPTRKGRHKPLPPGGVSRIGSVSERGAIYKRNPYAKRALMPTVSEISALQVAAASSNAAAVAAAVASSTEAGLKASITVLENQVVALQKIIDSEPDRLNGAVAAARLKERSKAGEQSMLSFREGLNAAMRISNNKEVRSEGSSSSACKPPTSAGGGSGVWGRMLQRSPGGSPLSD